MDLWLSNNAITAVPTELGALTALTNLDLADNAITSVPTEVGTLRSLELLGLQNNDLTSVPSEIAALPSLRYLRLNSNQLTGMPAEFRTWGPSGLCVLQDNPSFSCANVGASTKCCKAANCPNGGTSTCYQG